MRRFLVFAVAVLAVVVLVNNGPRQLRQFVTSIKQCIEKLPAEETCFSSLAPFFAFFVQNESNFGLIFIPP